MRRQLALPIAVACVLIGPLAGAAMVEMWNRRTNAFDVMAIDAATGTTINVDGVGWFTDTSLMFAPLAVLLLWQSRYRPWGWAIFIAFAIAQSGTGIRSPMICALVAAAMLYLLERQRKWFDWKVAVAALAGVLAFNQIVTDRGASVRTFLGGDSGDLYVSSRVAKPLEGMDFANMEYFEYVVYVVPQRSGSWDYFANNLQILTEPIPRVLWKDKPVGSPIQFFKFWDYGTPTGMTASMPGIGWMSFGWLGIIVQAAVFAMIFAFAYRRLVTERADPLSRMAYAILGGASLVVFRDGTLLTMLKLAPFYLGPLLIVFLLARFNGVGRSIPLRANTPTPASEFLATTPAERRRALADQAARGS